MRDAVGQAQQAATTAANTASVYGASAGNIGSALVPKLMQQMNNPSGYSQQDIGAQLTNALAGAGGANAALAGTAAKTAATMRDPMGFSAALGDAARSRDKAAASASEGIAAKNADVKLQQQQSAAAQLSGLYGTDVGAQNDQSGQVSRDVDAEVSANNSGWLQNALNVMNTISGAGMSAAKLGAHFPCWVAA